MRFALRMWLGLAAGLAGCGTANAQCAASPTPLIAASPGEADYVARFNVLAASDPYDQRVDMAVGWRALLADLERDPAAPAELVARTGGKLAAAMGQADDKNGALPVAREALKRAEANGLATTPLHAELLVQLALAEIEAGKGTDAVGHAEIGQTETMAAFGAHSWLTARAAMALAQAYHAAGRYLEAEPVAKLSEEVALACLAADDPRIVGRITSHASELYMSGRLDESLQEDQRAAGWALAHGHEHSPQMLSVLDNLGFDLRNIGRFREAEGVLRRGVDLAARYNPESWQLRAGLIGKLADVLEIEGHHSEAEALWLQASAFDRKVNDLSNPLIGSGEIRRAASAARAQGDLPLALARHQQAIALIAAHAPPNHPELARARLEYATTLSLAGRDADARAVADPAMAVVRATMPAGNFLRMAVEVGYARVVEESADAATAYPIAAPVADRMEAMLLDTATSHGDLIRMAQLFTASFATDAKLALATGREEQAFHEIQLANFSDIVLVNNDIAARAAAASPDARAVLKRLQRQIDDRRQLDRDRVRVMSGQDAARLAQIETALHDADAGIEASSGELDRIYPAYRRIGRPAPVTLAAFRPRLGADDVLIAPFFVGRETVTIAVTRAGLTWTSARTPGSQLRALVSRIRASVSASRAGGAGTFDAAAARQLYLALFPPALDPLLRSHRHIFYYASGILARVPPALLVERPLRRGAAPAWLIRSHSISILTTLDPPRSIDGHGHAFMGVGAPLLAGPAPRVFERGGATADMGEFGAIAASLPSLPHAARELRAMAATFPADDRKLMLGGAATERALKTVAVDQVGVLALATHGLMRDAVPGLTEPALVLTPPKTPDAIDDGLLTASEVANLHLRAEWVILSACDTAGGSDPSDASYNGLARAFIEAGARSLLVSHWAVRDDAAERITVATLRAARRGVDRASALQQAMIALMNDRKVAASSDPAVWAPFVLVETVGERAP